MEKKNNPLYFCTFHGSNGMFPHKSLITTEQLSSWSCGVKANWWAVGQAGGVTGVAFRWYHIRCAVETGVLWEGISAGIIAPKTASSSVIIKQHKSHWKSGDTKHLKYKRRPLLHVARLFIFMGASHFHPHYHSCQELSAVHLYTQMMVTYGRTLSSKSLFTNEALLPTIIIVEKML